MISLALCSILLAAPVQVTTVFDGLEIVSLEIPSSNQFAITVAVRGGSSHDPTGKHGLHHLLEHALFLGTQNQQLGAPDLFAEQHGCRLGANTYRELMVFTCEGPAESIDYGITALRMLFSVPDVSLSALQRETSVIAEELALQQTDPYRVALDALYSAACSNAMLARSTGGNLEQIQTLKPNDLSELFKSEFSKRNMVVSVCAPKNRAKQLAESFSMFAAGQVVEFEKFSSASPKRITGTQKCCGAAFSVPGANEPKRLAVWFVVVDMLRAACARDSIDVRVEFGPSVAGSLIILSSQDLKEPELRDFVTRFRSSDLTERDAAQSKRSVLAKMKSENESPIVWSTQTAVRRALGDASQSDQLVETVTLADIKQELQKLDPSAGTWLERK